ncbi:AMP-binding protein [Yinghuangia sp. ASG 101]|uniref:AMP-binding protein n=1 Tax=Yinghuangia sp. ASG 101 TaxID=2896848 RepID=UPI001E5A2172|nr:AMP-binding protein [Yinghuangia sp. ASG 101]UGQ12520.1 AMP-binding protein [Yinghuangia sp. ASG 101]
MKLSDADLWDDEPGTTRDDNTRPFPHDRTVGDLFAEQAAATPDAVAVVDGTERHTYAELAADADASADFLTRRGVGPGVHVAVLLRRSYRLVVALLGILRAGGAYVPLNPDLPDSRLRALVRDTAPRVLISERALTALANDLFWNSPATRALLSADSADALAEREPDGARMSPELWNHIADHAADPVSANGWHSPYTGARLGDATLERYVRATVDKLSGHLPPDAAVLEIGCGTGATLRGLAPRVGRYVGVDPSAGALRWAERACREQRLGNVSLHALGALELDALPEESTGPFDAVVLNSVVQSFGGLNYLRTVIGEAVARTGKRGVVYLGHVWDAARREEFVASVAARHRPEHAGRPLAAADALFVPAAFLADLPHHFPEIARVEIGPMAVDDEDLSAYAYDAILHVDRAAPRPGTPREPAKRQYDRRALDGPRAAATAHDRHRPDATAYVIQTSGSSGTPKSVAVGMRSLVNLLWWYRRACDLGPDARVLQTITCGFDASVKNYLAPLICGARVVLAPDTAYDPRVLLDLVDRERITVLNPGVPSAVYPLVELAEPDGFRPLRHLRHLALGGEPPDLARFRAWLASGACRATLHNIYGPTEATDISCAAPVDPAWVRDGTAPVPIGRPIPNTRAYVLDGRAAEAPPGVVGELCLAGTGLAAGYLGDPALTAEKFTTSAHLPGERLYRTGDLARRLPGGELVLAGRADNQVKLLGQRIELGEIEQRLRGLPGVLEAAAALRPPPGTDVPRLCGYVVPEPGTTPDPHSLRAALGGLLPAAAVPAEVIVVRDWPRTPNGKIDRNALPAPEQARGPARPPRTDTERALLPLWHDILGDATVSRDDDFFASGGHSLGAAMLAIRVREVFARDVSIVDVYRTKTVAALARLIDVRPAADSPLTLVADGNGASVHCFPPIAGYAWTTAEFARHLGVRTYAFDFPGTPDPVAAAADLIAATRTDGPRFLVGYSAGGLLAVATAHALRARGERVDGVVLLDSEPPDRRPPPGDAAVAHTVREVLDDPRLTAHIRQTGPDRVAETVAAYARWYAEAPPPGPVDCDLLVLTARDGDPEGSVGWRPFCTGEVHGGPARGHHLDLLTGTNATANADRVRTWLGARGGLGAGAARGIGPGIPPSAEDAGGR